MPSSVFSYNPKSLPLSQLTRVFLLSNRRGCPSDVLYIEPGVNPVRNHTITIAQLIQAIKTQFQPTLSSSPASTVEAWFKDGIECEFLDASAGGGWQKGKIRLRLEFISVEPDPPDSSALVPSPDPYQ